MSILTDYWSDLKTHERIVQRVDELWDNVDWLLKHPRAGQVEEQLDELGLGHRRWVVREVKIVYRIVGQVLLITEFFDSRQDPRKIKG